MDKKSLLKQALGRIKKLSLTATAARFKAKGEKSSPAEEKKPPEAEPESDMAEMDEVMPDDETPGVDVEEEEPDIMKKTILISVGRPTKSKAAPKEEMAMPMKRKPGRPKKAY